MPIPFAAIGAGLGAASALFGSRGNRYNYTPRQFSYNPDENDSELALLRRRFLFDADRDLGTTRDEIGRAGLLGSSAGFNLLEEQQRRKLRGLSDIDMSTMARRRLEALELFRDEENFNRQRSLSNQGYQQQRGLFGLGALGDIGQYLGGMDFGGSGLPTSALSNAANYDFELPALRSSYLR